MAAASTRPVPLAARARQLVVQVAERLVNQILVHAG
jgi:hypothetical protein